MRLTTEVPSSPGIYGDSLALTSRGIGLNSVADCSKVAVILTCIKDTVRQVSLRVQVFVAIFERPRLVCNNAAVTAAFVLALLFV